MEMFGLCLRQSRKHNPNQSFWSIIVRYHQLLILYLVLGVLLTACSTPVGEATEVPEIRGAQVAGRLLFVREGVIWEWRGATAQPLIGSGEAYQPAFSSDGSQIAYIARANSASELMLLAAGASEPQRLTDNVSAEPPNSLARVLDSRWVFYPTFTPDGSAIVVAGQAGRPVGDPPAEYNLSLFRLSLAGDIPAQLFGDGVAHCGRSVFAPDGTALAFVHAGRGIDGIQQIYRLNPAVGDAVPFPGVPAPSYDPAYSPDGRWLAFAARDGTSVDLFAVPGGGGAPLRLSDLGTARAPAFSPDGRQLAFLAIAPGAGGFDLYIADLRVDEAGNLQADAPQRISEGLAIDADSGLAWGP
jgi:TolB protein